ncbi:EAL domain-containing protein [Vibrio paucivorans]
MKTMNPPTSYKSRLVFTGNAYLSGIINATVMLLPIFVLSLGSILISLLLQLVGTPKSAETLLSVSVLIWQLFPVLLVIYFSLYLASVDRSARVIIILASFVISELMGWVTLSVLSGEVYMQYSYIDFAFEIAIILLVTPLYYPLCRLVNRTSNRLKITSKPVFEECMSLPVLGTSLDKKGFFPALNGSFAAKKEISDLMREGDFELYYQPQFDTSHGCVNGMEVLLRHRSKTGVISSPYFLRSFAKLGLMSDLDLWVIETALIEVSIFSDNPNFRVSINISPETFLVSEFTERVVDLIKRSELNFNQVEFEITEDLLIQDEQITWEVLKELRTLGISIALDDFGAGYSSIGYLTKFEFDKVKIDRLLVQNLKNRNGREMFRLTSKLVRLTGAQVVVEGVECEEEVDFMAQQGIHCLQGFYFFKPMPLAEIIETVTFCQHSTKDENYEFYSL